MITLSVPETLPGGYGVVRFSPDARKLIPTLASLCCLKEEEGDLHS